MPPRQAIDEEDLSANRAERAAAAIAAGILAGSHPPGSRLPEVALSASLGVSRNTFREAIKILAGRGLVRLSRHRSASVAELTAESVADLYRVRRLIELGGIDAARGAPAEDYHELGAAIARLARAADAEPGPEIIAADLEFHRALARLHKSPRIEQSYAACLDELRLGLALIDARATPLAHLMAQHRRIYGLLLDGDHDRCQAELEAHLAASERELLATIASSARSDGAA